MLKSWYMYLYHHDFLSFMGAEKHRIRTYLVCDTYNVLITAILSCQNQIIIITILYNSLGVAFETRDGPAYAPLTSIIQSVFWMIWKSCDLGCSFVRLKDVSLQPLALTNISLLMFGTCVEIMAGKQDKENLSRWWGEDRENPRDEPLSLDRALARSRREVHPEGFPIFTSSTWLIIYLAYFLPKPHFNQMFFGLQSIWHIYRVGKCRLTSPSDVITTCIRTHSRTSNG